MWTATGTPHEFDVSRHCADVTVDPARGVRIPADADRTPTCSGCCSRPTPSGGTERVLDRTVAYAKDRQAFGRAIGGFQAVQHRLADHAVRVRGMSLLVREAAPATRRRRRRTPTDASLLAEAERAAAAAGHILHDLLQLTGAIGFTWEYGLHFFERRVHHDARLAANPRRARHDLTRFCVRIGRQGRPIRTQKRDVGGVPGRGPGLRRRARAPDAGRGAAGAASTRTRSGRSGRGSPRCTTPATWAAAGRSSGAAGPTTTRCTT